MSALRLPSNWHTFTFQHKQFYLVDTHQAHNLSEAASILSKRTDRAIRAHIRKTLAECKPEPVRLPYVDN